MKSRSMKKFMRKAVSAVSAVAMAIMLAAPAVSTQAFAADGKAANSVTYIGKNTIKTYDGKSLTYDSSVTFTTKNSDGSYSELSLADAKTAVKDGQEVKVYTKAHAEGYGSVWSESYDYTNYRTGVQIGEDSDVAIGTEGVGGKLTGTLLEDFNLVSTSKNFNPIVVNKSDATIKGATIVAGNADGKDNSEGRNDINDFVGYGTAVNIYGDSVTTGGGADANGQMGGTTETNATYKTIIDMTEGGSITTYGVARPAVAVDNGGDVIIKGDGNDKTQEISVNGGTLYDGFKNTADTVKMVSPPWVLGVVGNSRATNMLGKGSTMVVQDADVYAKSWGALSTDSGSNPFLYAINSNISMDTTSDDASGYGTYAIGNAQEYFLGSTFNVPTYLTIAANGDNNNITLGATKKGQKITTQKAVWKDNVQSIIDYGTVTASETRETVVNSENFGVDIWGQATVNVNDATEFHTTSAAFLIKSASSVVNISKDATIDASIDANAKAESKLNGTSYGVVYQIIDNEDAAAAGISFPEGYAGPVFSDAEYSEAEGWLEASTASGDQGGQQPGGAPGGDMGEAPDGQPGGAPDGAPGGAAQKTTSVLNISDDDLKGNIYNGSGYYGDGQELTVNIKNGASITGAISATTIKHTTDGGKTQNTSIKEADYDQIGHVMNKPSYNGSNDVIVNVEKGGTWVADGTSIITKLTIADGASVAYGTAVDADGQAIQLKAGNTYENITVTAATSGTTVKSISNSNLITTADGSKIAYDSNITFTMKDGNGYKELSLSDAKTAVKAKKAVKVYTLSHKEGYGSVWNSNYTYTDYRTGIQIGENSGAAIGTAGVGGKLTGNTLSDLVLTSTSKNFNPVVVNKADATLDNPVIVVGNANGKNNSDGSADVNDFVGYGTAVNIYGDSVTTGGGADANGQMGGTTNTNATYKTDIDLSNGGSITTYGVARPAVAVDNGGDVLIKGDGNSKTQEISVNGGTLYDGFKNTADTVKMVSPPWVLGVVGNSRATNMLGKGSTMIVQDSDVYAKSWGALSTDSGSNPYLYAINSNITMDTTSKDASGYGTYAIGNAQEYFLGSTFDVPTYLTIAANGDNNTITMGATTKGQEITTQKAVWKDNTQSIIDYNKVTASETRETVINSENFGVDIWGQATVNVNDATTMNTKSAAFLIKSADSTVNLGADVTVNAATDVNAQAEKELNGTENGVVYQIIDNEDAAAKGISFPEGYAGPVFSDAEYSEAEGWMSEANKSERTNTSVLNIADKDLQGNIYNGSGYYGAANKLTVNIEDGASVTGAISATTIKHTTDGGKTQNTSIKEADYNQIGHVMNTPYYNGGNDVVVNVEKGGTWVADGTSIITKLTIADGATVTYGSAKDANGKAIKLEAGKTYENITVSDQPDETPAYTGLAQAEDGTWYYYLEGEIAYGISGLAQNEYGWWYVENGKVDFTHNGLVQNQYGWWYVQNGQINFGYTGLVANEYGWWYVQNGQINFNYTGLAQNEYGWWYVEGGKINFNYNSLAANEYGWWKIDGGKVNFDFTGAVEYNSAYYTVVNGKVIF